MMKKIICLIALTALIISAVPLSVSADTDDETDILPGITFIIGDVNLDKKVNIKDVTAIQKYLAKIIPLSLGQRKAANVDGKIGVDIRDATHLQKWLAHIVDELSGSNIIHGAHNNASGDSIVLPFVPA